MASFFLGPLLSSSVTLWLGLLAVGLLPQLIVSFQSKFEDTVLSTLGETRSIWGASKSYGGSGVGYCGISSSSSLCNSSRINISSSIRDFPDLHSELEDVSAAAPAPMSLWPLWRDMDLLDLLNEAVVNSSGDALTDQCRRDVKIFLMELGNFSLWAMQMWDASVRHPRGALWGELSQLGNFDECIAARSLQNQGEASLGSSYCLAALQIDPLFAAEEENVYLGTAWQRVKPPTHRLQVSRNKLNWAMCVPESCGPQQLAHLLNPTLEKLANPLKLSARIIPTLEMCQSATAVERTPWSSIFFWCVVAAYVFWLVLCAYIDLSPGRFSSRAVELARTFSIRRHWNTLTSTRQEGTLEQDDIATIHGLRVVGVVLVVIGHRAEAHGAGPLLNANAIEEMYADMSNIFVLNGSVIVDLFFVVGGWLLCWTLLGRLQRDKQTTLFQVYIYRYLRLTPALFAAVMFMAYGVPALGSGPLWASVALKEAGRCQRLWWTNILYINNLVRPDQPCLDPGWYLACDTQLYLLAPLLVCQLHKDKKRGVRILIAAFLFSIIYPAVVTHRLGLDGTIVPEPEFLGRTAETLIHMSVYVSAPCRAGPYLVGIAAAWWLRNNSSRARTVLQRWVRVVSLLLSAVALLTVGLGVFLYPPLSERTPRLFHAVYAGTHRTLFSAVIAFFIVVCAQGHLGWLSRPLSWPGLRPFSRLSYGVFLMHASIQLLSYGQQRTPYLFSTMDTVTMSLPDILYSFLAAAVLHLTVEAPALALSAYLRIKPTASEDKDIVAADLHGARTD